MVTEKISNYQAIKNLISNFLQIKYPTLFRLICCHKTGIKYVFSGGTAALVDLIFLYFLTDIIGIWYVYSAAAAFAASLVTSFVLQKFWTFRDNSFRHIKKQFVIYIVLGAINFFLTPALLYIIVEKFHVWYLLGAVFVMGALAMANYLINKFITFKKDAPHESVNV